MNQNQNEYYENIPHQKEIKNKKTIINDLNYQINKKSSLSQFNPIINFIKIHSFQ